MTSYLSPVQALWVSLFITAFYPIAGKMAVGFISPGMLLFLGALVCFIVCLPWLIKTKQLKELFNFKKAKYLMAVGLFNTALPFLCMFIALLYTTPSNASILNQTELLYSLILTWIFLGERPNKTQLLGSALLLTGVIIILMQNRWTPQWKGDIIVISSVWLYQVGHIFAKKMPKEFSPEFITAGRAFYGALFLIPLTYALTFIGLPIVFKPVLKSFLIILYLGAIFNTFGNMFWYRAIRNMDLSKATAVILSYPVFTYLISVCLGMDKISILQISGLAFAFSGAYLLTRVIRGKH
ncbi:MAG: EamA family transporter [Elusimicrobiaceae bacterium]|nr:EamA family transporter [Elusimicrobiaceae bacterium]